MLDDRHHETIVAIGDAPEFLSTLPAGRTEVRLARAAVQVHHQER